MMSINFRIYKNQEINKKYIFGCTNFIAQKSRNYMKFGTVAMTITLTRTNF